MNDPYSEFPTRLVVRRTNVVPFGAQTLPRSALTIYAAAEDGVRLDVLVHRSGLGETEAVLALGLLVAKGMLRLEGV
ncbi:MAG: hypothetical protein JNM74_23905 [Myxococcales bacterium]|nr:hypothetical protein [Myxococcales bacterium]